MTFNPRSIYRNKASSSLTKESNQKIFFLLKPSCVSLATTPVHLSVQHCLTGQSWTKKDEDVLCFVKNQPQKSYCFQLFSLVQKCLIWEKSLAEVRYVGAPKIFCALETKDYVITFDFTNEGEALEMDEVVQHKIEQLPIEENNAAKNQAKRNKPISKRDISLPITVQHLHSIHEQQFFESLDNHTINLIQTGVTPDSSVPNDRYLIDYTPFVIARLGGADAFSKGDSVRKIQRQSQQGDFGEMPLSWRHFLNHDNETLDFINNYINKHNQESTVEEPPVPKTRTKKGKNLLRPPKPPAPQPPSLQLKYPQTSDQSTSMFNNDRENSNTSVNNNEDQKSLRDMLAVALAKRNQALYSDDSAES